MNRLLQRTLIIAGYVGLASLVIAGMIALAPLFVPAQSTNHHGTIVNRFTSIESGTTVYHLLINESGTIIDVKTDATTWYTSAKVGDEYTWTTKDLPNAGYALAGILLLSTGTFGGLFWDFVWEDGLLQRDEAG